MKHTCFVMQVFDGSTYDRRFEETFSPAILDGGAIPVRADRILGSKPIIEKIEGALREATIVFAEISENNPNVFIELGYALDLGIPLVMVCDRAKRASLPFDIGHRPVIFYKTETAGDFAKLKNEIQTAIAAALLDACSIVPSAEPTLPTVARDAPSDELKDSLMLEVLEAETGDPTGVSAYTLTRALANDGFSTGLASLAILSLVKDGLIEKNAGHDRDGDPYVSYTLSESGTERLLARYAAIKRKQELARREATVPSSREYFLDILGEEPPF